MQLARACATAALPTLLLAGCGIWPFGKPAPREGAPDLAPLSGRTQRYLASRGLQLIENRPLNVHVDCTFRDEVGYGGRLDLDVRDAVVHRFAATVDIPAHGQCRFALRDFRQTTTLPSVTLAGAPGGCTVRMWQQGNQAAVAFSDCQVQCDAGSFDYLWPILVETPSGRCF
jgi:hypothetical protein